MKRKKIHPALRFQRQVLLFTALAILLLAASILLSASRTDIRIQPLLTRSPVQHVFRIGDESLAGSVLEEIVEASVTTTNLPAANEEDGYATGTVTIINNWTKAQPLQQGTRVMSVQGVLFRTQERVDVPARGTISVLVKADQPGPSGDIGPSTFEIVALWEGLKKDIYAKSDTAFSGGRVRVSRLDEATMLAAKKEARAELEKKAKTLMTASLQKSAQASSSLLGVSLTVLEETTNANVGDSISSLSVNMKARALGVAADGNGIDTQLLDEAQKSSAAGTGVQGLLPESREIEIQRADPATQSAEFSAHATALVAITKDHPLFDASRLTGRSRDELLSYFSQFNTLELVEITFSPLWSKSASPLPSNITITLLEPK